MHLFDQIVSHIIRPNRDYYRISKLGPKNFIVNSYINNSILQINRQDSIILNKQNKKIQMSYFTITKQNKGSQHFPNVIYLHANNGSRNQGLTYLKYLLQNQFNVVLFDCTGSGISDGEFVTLGIRESEDLQCVIKFLKQTKKINSIALWGRSMGAVTALLYVNKNNQDIKACVYDSPFYSLTKLIKQLACNKTGLPKFVFTPLLSIIQKQIKQKTNVSIKDLKFKNKLENIKCPGFFITSKNDKLVSPHHSEKIYNQYPARKFIEYIQNQHHQNRSKDLILRCIQFLKNEFKIQTQTKVYQEKMINFSKQKIIDINSLNSDNHSEGQQTKPTENNYGISYKDQKSNKKLNSKLNKNELMFQKISLTNLKKKRQNEYTSRDNVNKHQKHQEYEYRRTVTGYDMQHNLISGEQLQKNLQVNVNNNTKLSMFFDQKYKGIRKLQLKK